MDIKKAKLPWYVQAIFILFPALSVTLNVAVAVVLFSNPVKENTLKQSNLIRSSIHKKFNIHNEASVFTTRYFLSSLFAQFVVLTRHLEIAKFYHECGNVNKISLYFGTITVFGKMMSEASAFQPSYIYALLFYFIGAFLYGTAQVYIFFRNFAKHQLFTQCLRAIFCTAMLVNVVLLWAFTKGSDNLIHTLVHEVEVELKLEWCVAVNITFQQLWSYLMEKFHGDS